MTEQTSLPTRAYDLLEPIERQAVDNYVTFAIGNCRKQRIRVAHSLSMPIPSEYVRRSKGVLSKPLARAAVAEQLQKAANEEDLSPDRVISEHAAIAFSNMADYIDIQPFGDFTVKPLDMIGRDKLKAVKTLRTVPGPYGLRTEIVLYDKHPSLKTMGELMGLVAPDRPPALQEYSKKMIDQTPAGDKAPERAYVELLESSQCRT